VGDNLLALCCPCTGTFRMVAIAPPGTLPPLRRYRASLAAILPLTRRTGTLWMSTFVLGISWHVCSSIFQNRSCFDAEQVGTVTGRKNTEAFQLLRPSCQLLFKTLALRTTNTVSWLLTILVAISSGREYHAGLFKRNGGKVSLRIDRSNFGR
jgi:hypothetical protein